jgi:nicotinamidase-related amidase
MWRDNIRRDESREARIEESDRDGHRLNYRYADGQLKTVDIDSTRSAIKSLLDTYRAAKAPIIHIWHQTPSGAPVFTPDTPLSVIFDVLKPQEGETVISKNHPGSFTGTNLQEVIDKTGLKKVALVGYMAHVCVSTTARQAAERGYEVVLVREAIGDRDIPGIKAGELVDTVLKELADAFGTVLGVKEVK